MTSGWFVTGTDTGVGKTLVSEALLHDLVRQGRRAVGMKPVATGAVWRDGRLRSADADALLAAGNIEVEYADANPYVFEPPTAPTLVASAAGVTINPAIIDACFRRLMARSDSVVVEGVGGWLTPISDHRTMADVAQRLGLPVLLVVGVRLGAINHALLTQRAIRDHGCHLAGWVANHPDGPGPEGYVSELTRHLTAPCIGVIPPGSSAIVAAAQINGFSGRVITGKPES